MPMVLVLLYLCAMAGCIVSQVMWKRAHDQVTPGNIDALVRMFWWNGFQAACTAVLVSTAVVALVV